MSLSYRPGRWLLLLLGLALVRGLLYSAIIPPWMAPDEPRHFEYVRLIYENRRLVTGADLSLPVQQAIIASMDRFDFWRLGRFVNPRFQPGTMPQSFEDIWYPGEYDPNEPNMAHQIHQPPLYYALNAAVLLALPTDDVTAQLYALRVVSVLTGVAVVGLAYWVGLLLFPGDPAMQLAVPAFILFLPTYGFMASSVNNDRLAELAAALVISLLAYMFTRGVRIWSTLALAGALLLALLSKRSALFTWGLAPVAGCLMLWVHPPRRGRWSWVALTLLGLILLAGLGWALQIDRLGNSIEVLYRRVVRGVVIDPAMVIAELQTHPTRYIWRPFRSFWGRFGWENVGFPDGWFALPVLLVLAAGLGLVVLCGRALPGRAPFARWQWATLILFGIAIISVSVVNVISTIAGNLEQEWVIFVPHGRYWFPVLIPIATLLVAGLVTWVPQRYRRTWLNVMMLGMIAYDLAALTLIVIPHFYG